MMRLRATTRIQNEHMKTAREEKKMTQLDVASEAAVPISYYQRLEALNYPEMYDSLRVMNIADVLEILPECVFPEALRGSDFHAPLIQISEVKSNLLLRFQEVRRKRFIIPSPADEVERKEEEEMRDEQIPRIIETKMNENQSRAMALFYGIKCKFNKKGVRHTDRQTSKVLGCGKARACIIRGEAEFIVRFHCKREAENSLALTGKVL